MDRNSSLSAQSSAFPYSTAVIETKAGPPGSVSSGAPGRANRDSDSDNDDVPTGISKRRASVPRKVHPRYDELLAAFPPGARPRPSGAALRECATRMIELARADEALPLAAAMGELVKRLGGGKIDAVQMHELMQALKQAAGKLGPRRYGDTIGAIMHAAGGTSIKPDSMAVLIHHMAALEVTMGIHDHNPGAYMQSAMSALFDNGLATTPWEAGAKLRQQVFDTLFRANALDDNHTPTAEFLRSCTIDPLGQLPETRAKLEEHLRVLQEVSDRVDRALNEDPRPLTHFQSGNSTMRQAQKRMLRCFSYCVNTAGQRKGALTIGRLNDLLANEKKSRPKHLSGLETTSAAFIAGHFNIKSDELMRAAFKYGCDNPGSLEAAVALVVELKKDLHPHTFNICLAETAIAFTKTATPLFISHFLLRVGFTGDRRSLLKLVGDYLAREQLRFAPEMAYALFRPILKPASPALIDDAVRFVTESAATLQQPTLIELARAVVAGVARRDFGSTVNRIIEGLAAALPDGTDLNPVAEALWMASAMAAQGDNPLQARADLLALLDNPLVRDAVAGSAESFNRARDQLLVLAEVTAASPLAAARKGYRDEEVARLEAQRPRGQVSTYGAVDVLTKLHDLRLEALSADDASGAKRVEFLKAEIAHMKTMDAWLAGTDAILALERKLRKLSAPAKEAVATVEG